MPPRVRLYETDGTANQNFELGMVRGELRFMSNNDAFSSSVTSMTIENNGEVGIGTGAANPAQRLHVSAGNVLTDNNYGYYGRTSRNVSSRLLHIGTDDNVYLNANSNTTALRFQTNSANRLVIQNNGNVGIGNTNPAGALEIGTDNQGSGNTLLTVNGGGSGTAEGAKIRLGTAADHDSTYNYYFLDAI